MKIYLIGLPGSGKSTIGKELADELKLKFIDLDAEIEGSEGKNIKSIFQESGEPAFRVIESAHLKKWAKAEDQFVMATGGGAPCFYDNMEVINKSGKSIFLDVPVTEIIRRIHKTELSDRPLLGKAGTEELKERLQNLHRIRLPFYRRATFIFQGMRISVGELISKVTS